MATLPAISARVLPAALGAVAAVGIGRHLLRQRRKIDLSGRTILITGGSRGLGLALAREFGIRHGRVALCARDADELKAAAHDLRGRGVAVRTFVCDLKDASQISEMIEEVESTFGKIDVLVNNAGTILVGPAQTMAIKDFEEAMAVNFWAAVHTTLLLAPKMKQRGGGRIVNIASVGGKMPVPHLAPYCTSKFALSGFSATLRTELARDGVLVTGVNPGLMRTGSPRNASFKGNHRAEYAWFSIGDALPGISMSAKRAARRIVAAAIHGDAEVTLGLPAKLGAAAYGIAPNLQIELSSLINRLLPGSAAGDTGTKSGGESESWLTRSFVRYLGKRAEREYNQLQVPRRPALPAK